MLKIRLQRSGRKGRANYRLVVAEHSAPIQGRYIDLVGSYDPLVDKHGLKADEEKIGEWIKKGAKPTNTVARLLKGAGVKGMESFIVEMKDKKVKNPKEEPAAPAAAAPAPAAEPEAAPTAEEPAPAEATPEAPEAPAEEVSAVEETAPVEEEKPAESEAEAPAEDDKSAEATPEAPEPVAEETPAEEEAGEEEKAA